MNSDFVSLFFTVVTSGAVSSLIIYLAKSWITERLKHAIAHEYAQKLEAHRAALKSDYDVQLERLRAENAKQLAIETSARLSLSDAYKAAHERRLTAIERAWAIILKIHSVTPPCIPLSDLLTDEEQKNLPKSANFRSLIISSQADPLDKRLSRASEGMDEIRLFVGDRIYMLLFVYRAFHGRLEFLMQQSLDKGHLDPWWKDSFVYQVLPLVLSRDEIEELQHGRHRFDRLRSMLEVKFLQECQPILSGEAAAHFSLKQAMAIQEAVRAAAGATPQTGQAQG
jgi:hypothetical protein